MPGRFCRGLMIVGLSLFGLSACTPDPIKTSPRWTPEEQTRPGIEGGQKPVVLSYCYSSQLNRPQQVWDFAREDCSEGKLYFTDQDVLWTKCPLFQPVRVTFLCYPSKAKPSQAK